MNMKRYGVTIEHYIGDGALTHTFRRTSLARNSKTAMISVINQLIIEYKRLGQTPIIANFEVEQIK